MIWGMDAPAAAAGATVYRALAPRRGKPSGVAGRRLARGILGRPPMNEPTRRVRAWSTGVSSLVLGAAALLAQGGGPLDRLTVDDGLLAWDGIRLGMTIPQIERRVGATIAIQKSKEPGCPLWIADADHHGLGLTIGFPSPKPSGKAEWLRVRFGSELIQVSGRDLVEAFKAKFPTAEWLPPKEPAGIAEEDDLEPDYLVPGKEPQVVRFSPREAMILAKRACLG
jgi:hypothetical protein